MKTSDKVRSICDENSPQGCRHVCPLSDACLTKLGDDYQVWADRMNKAAEELGG